MEEDIWMVGRRNDNICTSRICTKLQLHNDETETSKSKPKFSFKILIRIQLQNFDQTSTTKCWLNFNLKILIKLHPQNLDQTLTPIFGLRIFLKIFDSFTKTQVQNLYQTFAAKSRLNYRQHAPQHQHQQHQSIKKLWVAIS